MAIRRSIPPTVVSGAVRSPDARLPARADLSRYTLTCTVTSAPDITDSSKSLSVFIERLDEGTGLWVVEGGAHWRGGTLNKDGTPLSVVTLRTWSTSGGAVVDSLKGSRVRLWANTPAIDPQSGDVLWAGTTGPVTVSATIADERAN